MADGPTHRCHYCDRDVIPDEREDSFGPTGDLGCPHCGAYGSADEFHTHEPWVRPLEKKKTNEPEKLHVVSTDDEKTFEDSSWTMACGIEVRAFEDGRLVPPTDFYPRAHAYKATCEDCRKACGL